MTKVKSLSVVLAVLAAPWGVATVGLAGRASWFRQDRKSTRLNSSHGYISYAGFCLKKKKPLGLLAGFWDLHLHMALVVVPAVRVIVAEPYCGLLGNVDRLRGTAGLPARLVHHEDD